MGEYRGRVQRFGARPPPNEVEHARSVWFFASSQLRNLEPVAVAGALELHAELTGRSESHLRDRMDRAFAVHLGEELQHAVIAGRLQFEKVAWSPPPSPDVEGPYEPEPWESDVLLDFIEVVVVDEDGAPVPGVAYQLKLPDGKVVAGETNHGGKCWAPKTPSGSCELTFPKLDGAVWAQG